MKLTLILACAAMTTACFAAGNPVLKEFGSKMTYYHSFELNDADLAEGKATASKYGSLKPVLKDGGFFGKCLFDGRVSIPTAGNIDMSSPGTMIIWVCPRTLPTEKGKIKNNPAWWIAHLRCEKVYIQFGMPGHFPWGRGSLLAIAYSGQKDWKKAEVYLWGVGATPTKWKNNEWHMLAFSWTPTGMSFSADGMPWRSTPLVKPFPKATATFNIGGRENPRGYQISVDELMIFPKALSNAELKKIYDTMKAAASKPAKK